MGDKLNRLERDKALFNPNARRKLVETIGQANPEIVAKVIVKALELQIVTEEFCLAKGVELDSEEISRFHKANFYEIDRHLERAIGGFVGSIVSQEG